MATIAGRGEYLCRSRLVTMPRAAVGQLAEGSTIAQLESFATLLARHRRERGLSQEKLAELAGLSLTGYGKVERGETRPRGLTVAALCRALGLEGEERTTFVRSAQGLADGPLDSERTAAWELYVELVTRTALSGLPPGDGMLREALDSLYGLFGTVRGLLRTRGPEVALANEQQTTTFASLAVQILNRVLRPVLSKWHPLLLHHEHQRGPGVSAMEHERTWPLDAELRSVLARVQVDLADYAERLAAMAGVPYPLVETG